MSKQSIKDQTIGPLDTTVMSLIHKFKGLVIKNLAHVYSQD